MTLAAGKSQALSVTYAPAAAGNAAGSLNIVSNASNPALAVSLSGSATAPPSPGVVTSNPSAVSFGGVQVGSSKALSATVTNTGGSDVVISQATVTGTGFTLSGMSVPLTLAAGKSQAVGVTYAPSVAGNAAGSLNIVSNASNPALAVSLSGSATAPPSPGVVASNPSAVGFGNVQLGTSKAMTATLTNSGGSDVVISQATATGTGFTLSGISVPMTLAAGKSQAVSVTYAPSAAGSAAGSLNIVSNASDPTLGVALSGSATVPPTPGVVAPNPSSMGFGSVQVGSNKTQSATLRNSGGSDVNISQATVSGTGFSLSGLDLPLKLSAGENFTFSVIFAPQAAGGSSGNISLTSDAATAIAKISLSATGTALGQLTISPASLNFGSVTLGSNKSLTATLAATGAGVTISSASVSSNEFALSGVSFPLTLAAGQSVPLTLKFTPQASGAASASLSLATNTSSSSITESLAGTGAAAPQHNVDLSWGPSTSTVAGYNVYRGGATGGPYTRLTSSPNTDTSYSDNSVKSGQTYYYVTTAIDQTGGESDFSNEVQAVVPNP